MAPELAAALLIGGIAAGMLLIGRVTGAVATQANRRLLRRGAHARGAEVVRRHIAIEVPVASDELLQAVVAHVDPHEAPPSVVSGVFVADRMADGVLFAFGSRLNTSFTLAVTVESAEEGSCRAEAEVLVWHEHDGIVDAVPEMERLFARVEQAVAALGGTVGAGEVRA